MQQQREIPVPGTESRSWGEWQRDWFMTPGDLDDFIFYDEPDKRTEPSDP